MLTALKNAKKSKDNSEGSSNNGQQEINANPDPPPESTSSILKKPVSAHTLNINKK